MEKFFFRIIKRDPCNKLQGSLKIFLCITKTHGTEDYKGFLVKRLVLNFTKAHFKTYQINKKKIKLKKVHFGPTEREKLQNMFLEATTIISKKPDHRSNGTQNTHRNTHNMIGTISTVATIQRYDSESQKKRTEGVCALARKCLNRCSQCRALYLFRFSLYTVWSCEMFRCTLKIVMSGELLTIHIRLVSKPSQKNAVSIPHARLIFSFY